MADGGSSGAGEQRLVIQGVSWDDYVEFNDRLGSAALRMWYCEGALELMVTSIRHESVKTTIARLVELFALETDQRINGYGSATFRARARERGAEPDECYVVGHTIDEYPEIVLEVVLTSGGIDKLEVYVGMGVREVWFYADERFELFELVGGAYQAVQRSRLLPGLDFEALARFAQIPDQHDALSALRSWLGERDG